MIEVGGDTYRTFNCGALNSPPITFSMGRKNPPTRGGSNFKSSRGKPRRDTGGGGSSRRDQHFLDDSFRPESAVDTVEGDEGDEDSEQEERGMIPHTTTFHAA